MTNFASYGIKHINSAKDDVDRHIEELRLVGYTVVEGAWHGDALDAVGQRLGQAYDRQTKVCGGVEVLRQIGEANTVRAPLVEDDALLAIAAYKPVLDIARRMMDDYVILNQQNGIINKANETHHQTSFHRDLPYQHFTSSAPIAVNALFCIDPFREDNGATWVVPGSHHWDLCPSEMTLKKLAVQALAPAGSFLVMDSMVFHAAGINRSDKPRRAINHLYTRGFCRQQIDLPAALNGAHADDPVLAELLGYKDRVPSSALEWRRQRLARVEAKAKAS